MNKERYRELCKTEKTIPIFLRDWWMDAVSMDGEWNVKLYELDSEIMGVLVYYLTNRANKKVITLPPLTQKNGIWIKYPQYQKQVTKISYENKVTKELLNQLEKEDVYSYNQNFDYNFQNWYEFYWREYIQTTRYTYVIEDLGDLKKVYDNFDKSLRCNIRKAEKVVQVKRNLSIEEFYNLNKITFERKGANIPYSFEIVKRIDEACKERKCREIFYAIDEYENINSAIYIVWDCHSAYYIMEGVNTEFLNSQATSLLLWKAIEHSSEYVKKFDFEGSMMQSIERFFRKYGGVQRQYFNIKKIYKHDCVYEFAKKIYKKINNR